MNSMMRAQDGVPVQRGADPGRARGVLHSRAHLDRPNVPGDRTPPDGAVPQHDKSGDDISHNTLRVLTRAQCIALLAKHHFGRLAFVADVGIMPQITPVNYLLDQDAVIIRSDTGSKLTAAIHDSAVAFEIDEIDDDKHTGWSVVTTGHATEVTAETELQRLRETHFASWAPGAKIHFVRIVLQRVSGRRITLTESASHWFG